MKKPLICQLSDFGPEYPGSFVDSLLGLARYCRERMQIETACFFSEKARQRRWLKRFDEQGVLYGFVPGKRNIIFPLIRLLKNYQPLIFHSHFDTFDLSASFLKLVGYRDLKIVWHLHSMAPLTLRQRIKDAVKVELVARNFADCFITDGDGVYQNATERGFPPDKLVLNHNGVNTARFSPDKERRQSMRRSLGASDGQTVFLLLGWIPVIKGVDLFVKAADGVVRDNNQRSLFLIVGRKETREFVSGLPESSGLGQALRILDPTEDFSLLLSGVDVLVAASRSEGSSYAVLEAMAAGKLVLCSDIPAAREIYGRLEGVWLFPTGDWKKLAELMKRSQELSSTERESLGQANCQYVAEHYSLERWSEKIGEVYSNLLNQ